MNSKQNKAMESAEFSQPNNPKRMPERSYDCGEDAKEPAMKIRKLNRMFSLTSDIFREVLTYCSRCDLNEISQATRQLNQVVQDYFQDQPFIPINGIAFIVNPPKSCADLLLVFDKKISKLCSNTIWSAMAIGLGENLFRARRIVLLFSNGFEIETEKIRKLENISAVSTNSVVSIIFDYASFFDTNPQTLSPLGNLLNILFSKCSRLRFDLKGDVPEDYSFPLLEYPSLLQYNEIEFTNPFAKCLKKDDVIEFLHQKSENQRKNPIRMRVLFPEIEWAEYLIQKTVTRFEQATEISPPFELQFCLNASAMIYFDELLLKNCKIGETLRYTVSNDEELLNTQRHTIERASET